MTSATKKMIERSGESVISEVEKLLRGYLFVGTFLERRYVQQLGTYRDVVEVAETEKDFKGLLVKARLLLRSIGSSEVILHDLSLLVKLRGQPPLGRHWFKVRHVTKDSGHATIQLKHIREAPLETPTVLKPAEISIEEQISEWGPVLTRLLRSATSPEGVICGLRFILLLIVTSGSALVYGVRSAAKFLQTALRDSSNLIRASTPFLITMANIFMRISGWMLYFLMIVWKDVFYVIRRVVDPQGTPPVVPTPTNRRLALPAPIPPGSYRQIQFAPSWPPQRPSYKKYDKNAGVQITEITD